MPEFLQSSFLFGAAAIAVPVLIHLFFRLKTKRVDLGTIRFLRIVLLHHAALTAPVLLGHHDGGDLEQAVADWVATVDPAAADGGFWEHRYFVPSLYDVRTSGDQ